MLPRQPHAQAALVLPVVFADTLIFRLRCPFGPYLSEGLDAIYSVVGQVEIIAELERELTQAKADGVMEFARQGVYMCRDRLEGKPTEQWKVGVMDCLIAATDYADNLRKTV